MKTTDYAGLKLRGMPFSVKKEDILFFFSDYKFYPESIKIGRDEDNNKTGEGAILFKDEEQCKKAYEEK